MRWVANSRIIDVALAAMVCAGTADTAFAQQYAPASIPQIVVSGTSEVILPPAKATFSISIATSGPSSAVASEENARISKAVSDALGRSGLKDKDIAASHLSVTPRWDYDEKTNHRKRNGFEQCHYRRAV